MNTVQKRMMSRFPKYNFGETGCEPSYVEQPTNNSDDIAGSFYKVRIETYDKQRYFSHSKEWDECDDPEYKGSIPKY